MSGISLYTIYLCVKNFKYVTLGPTLKHILNYYFYSSKKRRKIVFYKMQY